MTGQNLNNYFNFNIIWQKLVNRNLLTWRWIRAKKCYLLWRESTGGVGDHD